MSETNGQMWERLGFRITEGGRLQAQQFLPRKKKPKVKRDLPGELFSQILKAGLPLPDREHEFHPVRAWRFDLAWVDQKIAIECHGGVWVGGRHTRGEGYTEDRAKMNEAISLGWRVVEVTAEQIEAGLALAWARRTLEEDR